MAEPTLLQEVVELVREGIQQPRLLWQLVVIAAALGAGWLLTGYVRRRTAGRIAAESQQSALRIDVRRFSIDVTWTAKPGDRNVLAVEVFPPVKGDFTIGFVDWNPKPPDNSMGC